MKNRRKRKLAQQVYTVIPTSYWDLSIKYTILVGFTDEFHQ
jgi:hypothetical protein